MPPNHPQGQQANYGYNNRPGNGYPYGAQNPGPQPQYPNYANNNPQPHPGMNQNPNFHPNPYQNNGAGYSPPNGYQNYNRPAPNQNGRRRRRRSSELSKDFDIDLEDNFP